MSPIHSHSDGICHNYMVAELVYNNWNITQQCVTLFEKTVFILANFVFRKMLILNINGGMALLCYSIDSPELQNMWSSSLGVKLYLAVFLSICSCIIM